MMQLRGYQTKAIESINKRLEEHVNKQVAVLATGLGKTVIFSHLISQRNAKSGKKALILAHREELLTQAKDKLHKINPELRVDIEMADKHADEDNADVIVASIATLGRAGSKRLERFDVADFDTIVVDEAHHASASSYQNVLAHFGVLKVENVPNDDDFVDSPENTDWNNDLLLLGVTATPNRQDNNGIDQIFDEVVFNYGIIEGIQDGFLSRIRAYRINTKTSLENVHTRAGDFAQDELADAINNPERNELIVKTYQEQFANKQALVFAIDVAHAIELTKHFAKSNISVAFVTGDTPKESRKIILQHFHNKVIQVVVNCMVLTEGYDNDTIDTIMMARPTKSGILYQQMVGRGTRTHHEKPYLAIVDFVDNVHRHTIKTSASLLGEDAMIDFDGQDIVEAKKEIDKIKDLAPSFDLNKLDFEKLDYLMEEIDVMAGLEVPKDIVDYTPFAWHRFGENDFRIGLGESRYIVVRQSITGQYKAYFEFIDEKNQQISNELGTEESLMIMIQRVDKYINRAYPEVLKLIDMNTRWRQDKPSEKQIEALRRLRVSEGVIAQLDKGHASQLQTKLYAMGKGGRKW